MPNYRDVTIEELLKRTKIPLEVLDTDDDIYYDMVRVMMEEIRRNNSFSSAFCQVGFSNKCKNRTQRFVHCARFH